MNSKFRYQKYKILRNLASDSGILSIPSLISAWQPTALAGYLGQLADMRDSDSEPENWGYNPNNWTQFKPGLGQPYETADVYPTESFWDVNSKDQNGSNHFVQTTQASQISREWTEKTLDATDLVINGDFVNWTGDDPDNWTVSEDGSNYVTEDTGKARLISDNTFVLSMTQTITVVDGTSYNIGFDIGVNLAGWRFTATSGANSIPIANYTDVGSQSFNITADGTSLTIFFYRYAGASSDYTVDNVIVKKVLEWNKPVWGFDGTQDTKVAANPSFTFGDGAGTDYPFSIVVRVNLDSSQASHPILSKRFEWDFYIYNGDLYFLLWAQDGADFISGVWNTPTLDSWVNIVGRYDGSKASTGIDISTFNGSTVTSVKDTNTDSGVYDYQSYKSVPLIFGRVPTVGWLKGQVSHVSIYNSWLDDSVLTDIIHPEIA